MPKAEWSAHLKAVRWAVHWAECLVAPRAASRAGTLAPKMAALKVGPMAGKWALKRADSKVVHLVDSTAERSAATKADR